MTQQLRIRRGGNHHVAALGWSCKFFATPRCLYHRDAAKTYWTLAKLAPDHPSAVGKVLDYCIDEQDADADSDGTRYMEEVSECLRKFK